ncbi:hypothetical protein CYMTET_31059 [Cymbomonas tetramitiformis]|uniref:Cyclic nucleotide-binding domain-containing protein n=1 Tax=Cymbomonas tetramitiformis TaxID=36881 RepID=A0AAE0KTA2_9CHLO|nr:hypothetical protein CYMTET_31059 [Cymbomonas tetramitiformis]
MKLSRLFMSKTLRRATSVALQDPSITQSERGRNLSSASLASMLKVAHDVHFGLGMELSKAEVEELADYMFLVEHKAEQIVMSSGAHSDCLMFVLEGTVGMFGPDGTCVQQKAIGQYIGIEGYMRMGGMLPHLRRFEKIALHNCTLAAIRYDTLVNLQQTHPRLALLLTLKIGSELLLDLLPSGQVFYHRDDDTESLVKETQDDEQVHIVSDAEALETIQCMPCNMVHGGHLSSEDIKQLLPYMTVTQLKMHTTILKAGETGSFMVFILAGSVSASNTWSDAAEENSHTWHMEGFPGEIFGELALFLSTTRRITVVANHPSTIVGQLPYKVIPILCDSNPSLGFRLISSAWQSAMQKLEATLAAQLPVPRLNFCPLNLDEGYPELLDSLFEKAGLSYM